MKMKHTTQSCFRNPRRLIGLFSVVALSFLAFFAFANPSASRDTHITETTAARTITKIMPEGVFLNHRIARSNAPSVPAKIAESPKFGPLGNTLWQYNDQIGRA